jgi:hypothetical protein
MANEYDRTAIVERICERIAAGEALAAVCSDGDEKVATEYTRALQARAEWFAAEHDRIRKTAVNRDTAAAARVQLSGLEWQMSKMAPKRYGDRVDVEVGVKVDLTDILDRRRQRVIEANEQLGITGPDEHE